MEGLGQPRNALAQANLRDWFQSQAPPRFEPRPFQHTVTVLLRLGFCMGEVFVRVGILVRVGIQGRAEFGLKYNTSLKKRSLWQ